MAVNEENVWRLIHTALKRNEAHGSDAIDSIDAAWQELRGLGEKPGGSMDLDIAAAEHYLFARWYVASGNMSKRQMIDLFKWYYMKTRWVAAMDIPTDDAPADTPVQAPDIGVVTFGILGAIQGAADHSRDIS